VNAAPDLYEDAMLILRSSPPSPFGRKVKIAAKLLALWDQLDVQRADPTDPADSLRGQNPLGKIPALILDDGTVLYDSRVIIEYLDTLAGGGRIIPARGVERFQVLTMAALGDGIAEAALLMIYEIRFRTPELRSATWTANQQSKVDRALVVLERKPPELAALPDAGAISVACALGYLDLRFDGQWRQTYPRLVDWLDRFAEAVPAFDETKVVA
jgi:glutathione S-transferase